MDRFDQEVGRRIRDARRNASMTQVQLAEAIGVHRPALTIMESGKQRTLLSALVRIARVLDRDVDEFVPKLEEDLSTVVDNREVVRDAYLLERARALVTVFDLGESKEKIEAARNALVFHVLSDYPDNVRLHALYRRSCQVTGEGGRYS